MKFYDEKYGYQSIAREKYNRILEVKKLYLIFQNWSKNILIMMCNQNNI